MLQELPKKSTEPTATPPLPSISQLNQLATPSNCIRQREHRGYSLFHIGQGLIYKRFHFPRNQRLSPDTAEWETEQAILHRLAELPGVPQSYGYQTELTQTEQRYHCLRQYIDGEAVSSFEPDDIRWLARFFAQLHKRGVTTNDPQLKNFVRSHHGQLYCIDFGKGCLHGRQSVRFYWQVGRELFDIKRCALGGHHSDWQLFTGVYRQQQVFNPWEVWLLRGVFAALIPYRLYRDSIKKRRKAARRSRKSQKARKPRSHLEQ